MNVWAWVLIGYFALNVIMGTFLAGRPKAAKPAPTAGVAAGTVFGYLILYAGLVVILLGAVGVLS